MFLGQYICQDNKQTGEKICIYCSTFPHHPSACKRTNQHLFWASSSVSFKNYHRGKEVTRSGEETADLVPLSVEAALLPAPCSVGWPVQFLIECRSKNKSFSFHCYDRPKLWPYSHLYYLCCLHSPSHLSELSHCHRCLLNTAVSHPPTPTPHLYFYSPLFSLMV